MTIEKIAVLGCGLMGAGIVEVCARAGLETLVREIDDATLDAGLERIRRSLGRAAAKGKLSEPEAEEALGRITGTVDFEALADADLVIEAIIESVKEKVGAFAALDQIVKSEAIFASNTSSLTITELAAATARSDRFIGLHFFNPVPVMKLVEVVRILTTADETIAEARDFVQRIGKQAVLCRDNSGFIVNRLLVPYLLDAIRAVEEGVGSVEDIDTAMQLGCGYPMGPLTLLDFVGLDTTFYIANIMFEEYREKRFAPPPLLKRMVLAGHNGRKSGRGFYDYSK